MTENTTDDWRHQAACADADPELFQPEVATQEQIDATIAEYCDHCPVRQQCLELALAQAGGAYGIHGGRWFGDAPRNPAAEQCSWCGEDMDAERTTAAYCSTRCRVAAHRARQAALSA